MTTFELTVGDVITNDQLCLVFKCSPQGGMRRAHKTNTLIIISDHTKSIYEDRWEGAVMHYTGMGLKGDQSVNYMQNKTLNESPSNGVILHLFEVFEAKKYTYQGKVSLVDEPYVEIQPDSTGTSRQVIIFPLGREDSSIPSVSGTSMEKLRETKTRNAKRLTDEELAKRAKGARPRSGTRNVTTPQHIRSPYVSEHAKRRAGGVCQLCEEPAPFKNAKGEPYLETHHIVWMSRGGTDTPENTVALCPNCHRRMHVVDSKTDIRKLQSMNRV